jgi:hypothetical protein
MRCVTLLVWLAVVVAAGSALAADTEVAVAPGPFCKSLDRVLDAAADGFDSIQGRPKHRKLGMWWATISMPESKDCLVFESPLAFYSCTLYVGDDEEGADDAYDTAVANLKACLPQGWKTHEVVDALHTQTTAWRNGHSHTIRIVSRVSHAAGYLVDFWVDSAPAAAMRSARARGR